MVSSTITFLFLFLTTCQWNIVSSLYTGYNWEASSLEMILDSSFPVTALFSSSNGQYIIANTGNKTYYRSIDSGLTWEVMTGNECFPTWEPHFVVSGNGQVIYSTSVEKSLCISNDYGTSFTPLNASQTIIAVATDESGRNLIISEFSNSVRRLIVSNDFGETFTPSSPTGYSYWSVSASANFQNIIAISSSSQVQNDNRIRFHYSMDAGLNFVDAMVSIDLLGKTELYVTCDKSCKHAAVTGIATISGNGGIWLTSNYGQNWGFSSIPNTWLTLQLVFDATGQYILTTAENDNPNNLHSLYFSNNYGSSWQALLDLPVPLYAPYGLVTNDSASTIYLTYVQNGFPKVRKGSAVDSPTASPTISPTAAPSPFPSPLPTAQPTATRRTRVTINGNTSILGVPIEDFDKDYLDALERGIEATALPNQTTVASVKEVTGVDSTVRKLSVIPTFRKDLHVETNVAAKSLQPATVLVLFNVSAIMEESGLIQATAFDVVMNYLHQAVLTGKLTNITNDYLTERKGSGNFTSLRIVSISASRQDTRFEVIYEANSESSADSEDLTMEDIIIIVVVIGATSLLLLTGWLLYWAMHNRQYSKTPVQDENHDEQIIGKSTEVVITNGGQVGMNI